MEYQPSNIFEKTSALFKPNLRNNEELDGTTIAALRSEAAIKIH